MLKVCRGALSPTNVPRCTLGRPLAALQGLEVARCVIYSGTFSFADMHSPALEQAVLAEFITEGHFARHIRRTPAPYAERQTALVEAAQQLSAWRTIRPCEAGMHMSGWLLTGSDDQAIARLAAQHQIITHSLSHHCIAPPEQRGLLLGDASVPIPANRAGVRGLVAALSSSMRPVGVAQRSHCDQGLDRGQPFC